MVRRLYYKLYKIMLSYFLTLIMILSTGESLETNKNTSSYQLRKTISEARMDAAAIRHIPEQIKLYAEAGDAISQYEMWILDNEGTCVPKNQQIALEWLKLSAEQGYPPAMYCLGRYCYSNDKNEEAFLWFLQAALLGNTDAQVCTAICYRSNIGTFANDRIALQWMTKAARQGNPRAQYDVGVCYQQGAKGAGKIDLNKAYYWFTKSAEQNIPGSCINLGMLYLDGIVVKKNPQKARELFLKAAAQNDPIAMGNLGEMSLHGIGGSVNPKEAVKWFEQAAKRGYTEAQFALAEILDAGQGDITQNQSRAFELYQQAADQGLFQAQFRLATYYASGTATPQNNKLAFHWYKKAADQGFNEAEYITGLFYLAGNGVEKNLQLAREYLAKAAAQGHQKAQETLDKICTEDIADSDPPSATKDSPKNKAIQNKNNNQKLVDQDSVRDHITNESNSKKQSDNDHFPSKSHIQNISGLDY